MKFGRAVKIAFRVPIRNIFQKNTVSEKESFSSQFRKSSEKVFAFCWRFLGWGCQGHLLRVLWKVLRDFFDFFFLSLSVEDTDWKNSGFFLKTFRRNCQNCIPGVRGKTLGKDFLFKILFFSSFLDNEPKVVGLLTNFLWQSFENYILRVQ